MEGVDAVIENRALLASMLVPKPWLAASDVSIFLPLAAATPSARRSGPGWRRSTGSQGDLRVAAGGVPRLPEKVRKVAKDSASPVSTWSSVPAAFRVALDQPSRVREIHVAFCGSRRTGDCPGDLVVLEHPRR